MTDSPIDFTSLDAGGDGARREALARRIELAAAAELVRRRHLRVTPQVLLLRRARPLLGAAAAIALAAGASLYRAAASPTDPAAGVLAELAGVSYESALGVTSGSPGMLLGGLVFQEAP